MDELQSSQYLKATYQSSGGLIHLSGWHPNRFGGESEGGVNFSRPGWIYTRKASARDKEVQGFRLAPVCFFVIDERYNDVWHLDGNCLVTTQQLPRAKPGQAPHTCSSLSALLSPDSWYLPWPSLSRQPQPNPISSEQPTTHPSLPTQLIHQTLDLHVYYQATD